jgi:hypothetical protein
MSLSVMLEQIEVSIDVLHGTPDGAHATTRLLKLQKQLQGISDD